MTPEVYEFTRKFGRGQQVQEKPSVIQQIAGTLGNVALTGAGIAGAYGLARALGPETDISPVSTGVMSDVGEPKDKFTYTKNYKGNKSGNYGNPPKKESPSYKGMTRTQVVPEDDRNYGNQVGTVGSLQGGQDEILNKLQRQQEMSEAGDKALDQVENMMGMGNIPPDVRESLKEEAFGAVDVDNNDFVNEFLSQLASDTGNVENTAIPVKDPRSNRFESIRQQEEDRAELDYIMSGGAALDQGFENALALDDARESTFGIPAGRQIGNIGSLVTGPETVIEASPQKSQGLISAIKQEAQDFDHNIPWGERVDQAANSNSALGAAGVMAGTVAEKGAKDVGTRVKKIVTGVPQSINTVRNIASDIGETVTREVINSSIIPDNKMQPSKWAEAARLAAGFAPLGGSGGVEIGNESDLSDNAQFDDPQQQNEQITPAGINRQTSGLAPDPVEGEMQTIAQAVNDLATSFGQGLAHLSPEERVDIARKMIEKDLRKDGYQGPINFG
jgi:hypothetical protein